MLLSRRCVLCAAMFAGLGPTLPQTVQYIAEAPPEGVPPDLDRPDAMKLLLATYDKQIREILDTVITNTSGDTLSRLQSASLKFTANEHAFEFFSQAGDVVRQKIVVSLGGLSSLEICAIAYIISEQKSNDLWWFNYLLYHRKLIQRQSNPNWVEPGDAGYGPAYNKQVAEKLAIPSELLFNDMTLFILAHEAGHVALQHKGQPENTESRTAYLARLRQQELNADQFALDLTHKIGLDPFPVTYTMISHMILLEQDPRSAEQSDHPADHDRLLQISKYLSSVGTEASKIEFLQRFATYFSSPLSYASLNALSESVTLESLSK
jgi:hypothetical protein